MPQKIMTKEEFESRVQSLVGERIKRVTYFELNYDDGKEYWSENQNFDSLDYGIDFEMESNTTKGIIWGSEFYQYGVSLIPSSLNTELKESKKINVSDRSRWKELVGKEITSVKTIWSWVKEDGFLKKKIYYPQDLVLTFQEDTTVYISVLEIRDNSHFSMADNITVFFDESVARKYCDITA